MLRPYAPYIGIGREFAPRGGGLGAGERFVFLGREHDKLTVFPREAQNDPRHIILHRGRKTSGGFQGLVEKLGHREIIVTSLPFR